MKIRQIYCEKCNGEVLISKATGDLFCSKCNHILTDSEFKKILDESYKQVGEQHDCK